jgi:hypothetical protein
MFNVNSIGKRIFSKRFGEGIITNITTQVGIGKFIYQSGYYLYDLTGKGIQDGGARYFKFYA